MNISKQLEALNIKKGDIVLIHSSFSSLGKVDAKEFIEAIIAHLGDKGTLVFPALSYMNCTEENPHFDYYNTKTCVGYLPEFFRTQIDGVVRSMHPTHSCTAFGYKADEITKHHHLDSTPVGENSPFRKVMENGGKLLFIGCTSTPNTSMHGVEEFVEPDYLYGAELEYTLTNADKTEYTKSYRRHGFKNTVQRYERIERLLNENEMKKGKLLEADCVALDAKAVWHKALCQLKTDIHFFVDIEN
ncbi:AAC(3) family N-acetyltransferase [Eubacteriales bacterium OttesenSCG-928-G02]|nr:AAC(3) family N-acetyltransferase [Eubacteriales bacterium OttesenSCG-928-G02]